MSFDVRLDHVMKTSSPRLGYDAFPLCICVDLLMLLHHHITTLDLLLAIRNRWFWSITTGDALDELGRCFVQHHMGMLQCMHTLQ